MLRFQTYFPSSIFHLTSPLFHITPSTLLYKIFSTYALIIHTFLLSLQHQFINTMARNTINSYVWLAETIHKAKKISFEEINRRWMDNDMSEGKPLSRRDVWSRHRKRTRR